MTQRETLRYLLEHYYRGDYDARAFCSQFVPIVSEGLEDDFAPHEKRAMQEFCKLAERYSPYEEDINMSAFFVSDDKFRVLFQQLYERYFTGNLEHRI